MPDCTAQAAVLALLPRFSVGIWRDGLDTYAAKLHIKERYLEADKL